MEPVRRVPIVQQVENRMLHLIEDGTYKPGEKLPVEKDLCQQMSVGRGTVREAFRLLQARGYVEIKPGRGAFAARGGGEANARREELLRQFDASARELCFLGMTPEELAERIERAAETRKGEEA